MTIFAISSIFSSGSFSPNQLDLNLYVRTNYSGSPWKGVSSRGSSSSYNLTESTNPPSTGTPQNGWTPANFDGTNDRLGSTIVSNLIGGSPTTWSMFVIVNPDTLLADTNYYDEACLFGDTGGNWTMSLSASGARITQWDNVPGSTTSAYVPVDAGTWSVVQARWTGTQVQLRVNKGEWVGFSMSTFWTSVLSNNTIVGINYDATKFFDGRIAEIGVSDLSFSDSEFDKIVDYAIRRYALQLDPNMIPGLQLWIDSETRVADTGGLIDSVGDRSYNRYSVTQTGTNRPTTSGGIFKGITKKSIDTTAATPNYLNVGSWNFWNGIGVSYWAVIKYTSTETTSGNEANPPLTLFGHTAGQSYRYVGFSSGQADYRFPPDYNAGYYLSFKSTTTTLNDGNPHSVAWCHNNDGTLRIYVDGVLDSTHTNLVYTTTVTNIQDTFLDAIALSYLGIDSYVGHLAEACVFKADLTAAQVSLLHQRAVALWI